MRVLSIGTDRKILEAGSPARVRQERYADRLGHLDAIVFAKNDARKMAAGPLQIVPTNSASKLFYGFDAWRIAKKLPKPDVVTVQDPFETGLVALFIARSLGVPLHVQIHTDPTAKMFVRSSLVNRIRRRLMWFVLRRAARIRVVLGRTKDDLRARGISAPISVLPIFVDVARLRALPRMKHPRFKISLLFVGRLEKEKHPCLALDALIAARRAGHDAGLTVVGEGSELSLLKERARKFGVESRVEFLGWQSDIGPQLSRADIVLMPSRYEGYGLAIVESLAAGVPVLSTDVGVAREAGAIIASPREFASAVVRWVQDGPRSGSLASYPYRDFDEYVERYCADIQAARGSPEA